MRQASNVAPLLLTALAESLAPGRAWRARELALFGAAPGAAHATYAQVPWVLEPWAIPPAGAPASAASALAGRFEHYAHVSTADPSKLAYTPSERHGREDRQVRCKPGKYLRKYFSNVLNPQEIAEWAGKFAAANEQLDLQIARSADDCARVYIGGPRSCMGGGGGSDCWDSPGSHPARVYGAGSLGVAYIGELDGAKARALVRLEDGAPRVYSRIYGDERRLAAALERAGFEPDAGADFNGAALLRIPDDSGEGEYIGPYLDGSYSVDEGIDDKLHMQRHGSLPADSTDGYFGSGLPCENCGGRADREEYSTVDEQVWCNSCAENSSFYCEYCETSRPDSAYAACVQDASICDDCFASSCFRCEKCSEPERDEDGVDVGDDKWCKSCAEDKATCCEHCEMWVDAEDTQTVGSRRSAQVWCDDCAESDASTCEDCLSGEDLHPTEDCVQRDGLTYCESCDPGEPDEDEDEDEDASAPAPAPAPAPIGAPAPAPAAPCAVCAGALGAGPCAGALEPDPLRAPASGAQRCAAHASAAGPLTRARARVNSRSCSSAGAYARGPCAGPLERCADGAQRCESHAGALAPIWNTQRRSISGY